MRPVLVERIPLCRPRQLESRTGRLRADEPGEAASRVARGITEHAHGRARQPLAGRAVAAELLERVAAADEVTVIRLALDRNGSEHLRGADRPASGIPAIPPIHRRPGVAP